MLGVVRILLHERPDAFHDLGNRLQVFRLMVAALADAFQKIFE